MSSKKKFDFIGWFVVLLMVINIFILPIMFLGTFISPKGTGEQAINIMGWWFGIWVIAWVLSVMNSSSSKPEHIKDIHKYINEKSSVQNTHNNNSYNSYQNNGYNDCDYYESDTNNSSSMIGSIAVGVALGAVASKAINDHYAKSNVNLSIRMKEQELQSEIDMRDRAKRLSKNTSNYDARIDKLEMELQALYNKREVMR